MTGNKNMNKVRLAEIVNDINKGIDNGESREELREALMFCMDMHIEHVSNSNFEKFEQLQKFVKKFNEI